jgi:hypothetical protein
MLMQYSNDPYSLTIDQKINGIGKSTHQYAPKIFETTFIRQLRPTLHRRLPRDE